MRVNSETPPDKTDGVTAPKFVGCKLLHNLADGKVRVWEMSRACEEDAVNSGFEFCETLEEAEAVLRRKQLIAKYDVVVCDPQLDSILVSSIPILRADEYKPSEQEKFSGEIEKACIEHNSVVVISDVFILSRTKVYDFSTVIKVYGSSNWSPTRSKYNLLTYDPTIAFRAERTEAMKKIRRFNVTNFQPQACKEIVDLARRLLGSNQKSILLCLKPSSHLKHSDGLAAIAIELIEELAGKNLQGLLDVFPKSRLAENLHTCWINLAGVEAAVRLNKKNNELHRIAVDAVSRFTTVSGGTNRLFVDRQARKFSFQPRETFVSHYYFPSVLLKSEERVCKFLRKVLKLTDHQLPQPPKKPPTLDQWLKSTNLS